PAGASRTAAATTVPTTASSPAAVTVAGPAPNRRYSVRRRSASAPGSAARWAPRLFRGAARNAAVGHTSKAAVTQPPIPPARPSPPDPAGGRRRHDPGQTERTEKRLGEVAPDRVPPPGVLGGLGSPQELRLAREQPLDRRTGDHEGGGLPDHERAEGVAPGR